MVINYYELITKQTTMDENEAGIALETEKRKRLQTRTITIGGVTALVTALITGVTS